MDTLMHNCLKKAMRLFRGKICNPYANNVHVNSTIGSVNLGSVNCHRFKSGTNNDYLYSRYIKLGSSDRILNVSNKTLPNRIIRILSLGDSFNLPLNFRNNNIKLFRGVLADTEAIIDSLDTVVGHKNEIRNQVNDVFCRFLKRGSTNNDRGLFSRMIISDTQFLRQFLNCNKDVKIIKADKSKQLVIMENTQYLDKMMRLISDKNNYKPLRDNPGLVVSNKVGLFVDKLIKFKFIPRNQKSYLSNPHYIDPRIGGLAKNPQKRYPSSSNY